MTLFHHLPGTDYNIMITAIDNQKSSTMTTGSPDDTALSTAVEAYESEIERWWNNLDLLTASSDPNVIKNKINQAMQQELNARIEQHGPDYDMDLLANLADKDLQVKVDSLVLRANIADGKYAEQLKLWTEAMRLLPQDRFFVPYETTSYILLGSADTLQRACKLDLALSTIKLAMYVPGTEEIAYGHFLDGQIKFSLGDNNGASKAFGRAYLIDKEEEGGLFDGNDIEDDAKFLALAQQGAAELEKTIKENEEDISNQ